MMEPKTDFGKHIEKQYEKKVSCKRCLVEAIRRLESVIDGSVMCSA